MKVMRSTCLSVLFKSNHNEASTTRTFDIEFPSLKPASGIYETGQTWQSFLRGNAHDRVDIGKYSLYFPTNKY